jgi:hypothetical protein
MNERIIELANKANETVGHTFRLEDAKQLHELMEKFAELIVRECIGCCEQVISDPVPKSVDTWLNGGSQCIDEIKKHFGVEEE